jgi:hypothetical protein
MADEAEPNLEEEPGDEAGCHYPGRTLASDAGLKWRLDHRATAGTMPLEQALWVTDREVTRIYAPGTPEQRSIAWQFRSTGSVAADQRFQAPLLYRMGMSSSGKASEGVLMIGFDPRHPEMALGLKSGAGREEW